MGLVTLTFDCLTLKLVCESHLRWGTLLPNLGTLGLWVLELFALYATDGRTKATLTAPFPTGGDIIMHFTVPKADVCLLTTSDNFFIVWSLTVTVCYNMIICDTKKRRLVNLNVDNEKIRGHNGRNDIRLLFNFKVAFIRWDLLIFIFHNLTSELSLIVL